MSGTPDLAPGAASLLEAEPRLGRAVGRRKAAAIGGRPILPVLSVMPGPWNPPAASQLGAGTIALAVLDGLLTGEGAPVLGPGDMIAPWGSAWVVATPVRLAVIGSAYLEPLRPWPGALERVRARAVAPKAIHGPPTGTLEERLAALLWWVALRWGTIQGAGVTLPPSVDLRAVSLLLDAEETPTALALAALRDDGVGTTRGGAMWLASGSRRPGRVPGRRDALRARAAVQVALARATCADSVELCDDLDLVLRRRDDLRRARGPAQSASVVER